jgi:hypothetical protein
MTYFKMQITLKQTNLENLIVNVIGNKYPHKN